MAKHPPASSAQSPQDSAELVAWLQRPEIYPDCNPDGLEQVELVETHISWVFLTRQFAYKLKKPVKFDFLDFSTTEARRTACAEELRLNSRLAAEVYLAVVPVLAVEGGFKFGTGDERDAVDWLVVMRRLPESARLDVRLQSGEVGRDDLEAIATKLTEFYAELPPAEITPNEYLPTFYRHVFDNRMVLGRCEELPQDLVDRALMFQQRWLQAAPQLFTARVKQGAIVEGHGDLRPEHIYLLDPPVMIDCIEFSADFRRIDVADELCFLTMECDLLGHYREGAALRDRVLSARGDDPQFGLLMFYQCYRACVRAKVAVLRAAQQAGEARSASHRLASRCLELANRYTFDWSPVRAIIVRGLMGTGKSTLARSLSQLLGALLLQTDVIRQELQGRATGDSDFDSDRYAPELRAAVYQEMMHRAGIALARQVTTILDGTFLKEADRQRMAEIAAQQGAEFLIIDCHCPPDVAQQRIAERLAGGNDPSEARPELYSAQAAEDEPTLPEDNVIRIDTTQPLVAQVQRVIAHL